MESGLFAVSLPAIGPVIPSTKCATQGARRTRTKLNVASVATGYRGSKIITDAVINEMNEKINAIEDLCDPYASRRAIRKTVHRSAWLMKHWT